jgi:hypothetical protein
MVREKSWVANPCHPTSPNPRLDEHGQPEIIIVITGLKQSGPPRRFPEFKVHSVFTQWDLVVQSVVK